MNRPDCHSLLARSSEHHRSSARRRLTLAGMDDKAFTCKALSPPATAVKTGFENRSTAAGCTRQRSAAPRPLRVVSKAATSQRRERAQAKMPHIRKLFPVGWLLGRSF